jgi:malate dehydrogenase
MGILSTGAYGVPEGLIYSFPCTCAEGVYSVVDGAEVNDFSRAKMDTTAQELTEERDAVRHLLG